MGVFKSLFVAGRPVITSEHINDEKAHPFYLNPAGYKTLQTTGSQAGYWAKIGTVTIQAQYKHFEAKISFMSGSATSNTQRGEWFLKVIQSAALGSAPVIRSRLKNYSFISVDQVKVVTVQNDATQTKLELYVKITNAYDNMFFNPYHCVFDKTSMFVRWWEEADAVALTQSLPTGTTTDALEDITYSNATPDASQSITATAWTKVLFKTETNDYKSEYDAPNSKFIPNQNGVYTVNAGIRMTSPSVSERALAVYVNGAKAKPLVSGAYSIISGSATVKLNAFDYMEIYVYSPDAVTIEANTIDTFFTVKH